MRLTPALKAVASGMSITYSSTDIAGNVIAVSGAVLRPKAMRGPGKHVVIAWGHGTAGYADPCAPSHFPNFFPDAGYQNYSDTLVSYLRRGYTVAASDFPGLGVAGPHPYLVGMSEGKAMIDSVRAARNLYPSLKKNWLATGHSQGGQGALFAGELAGTYGAGLHLLGVVAAAPASNIDLLAQGIAGTPGQGYLVLGLYGLAAVDPSVHPLDYLAQPAQDRVSVLKTGCFNEILTTFADLSAEELLHDGVLPEDVVAKFGASGNPAQMSTAAPILLMQGTFDATIPTEVTELLASQECSIGSAVGLKEYGNEDHDSVLYVSRRDVLAFLNDRVVGRSFTSDC